ncbi:MAG TPA: hypothetical protein VG498_14510 [Terriglobales bacterium]|nr:hypothetical protein [Terriglobales bacterium]
MPLIGAVCYRNTTAPTHPMIYVVVEFNSGVFAMLTYVKSDGRLFGLDPAEWSMLVGGVVLCGLLTLLLTS